MARVVIEHLTKTFPGPQGGEIRAVQGVNLTVEDKEFMVLVGRSGCGKSTTLRLIAGLEEMERGSVAIDGRVMNEVSPKDRDVAMVFQNFALYPHMTVFENMAFGLKLRKFPDREIRPRVLEAAELLGLTPTLDRRPGGLSGGERQRVALGRAMVRQPKVFLFDEPLSNLDAPMRARLRAQIKQVHQRVGATMIYVTHDQAEAMIMGDRIAVMEDGLIQQVAEPRALYRSPANLFVAGFLGSPPMNLFPGTLAQRGTDFLFRLETQPGCSHLELALPFSEGQGRSLGRHLGKTIIMGLRPEDITLRAGDRAASGAGNTLEARLVSTEFVGGGSLLHLTAGPHQFTARISGAADVAPSPSIVVLCELAKASLFDAKTGLAVASVA